MSEEKQVRNEELRKIGKAIEKNLPRFYGYIKLNFSNGKYINANVYEDVRHNN